jgi:hypothetical protein
MRDEFEMPCFIEIGLKTIETHEMTVAVELEPDKNQGWYVARVFVEGTMPELPKRAFHEIEDTQPLYAKIALYAYQYRREQLEELWETWLDDHPRARQLRSDAEREHRTHEGVL